MPLASLEKCWVIVMEWNTTGISSERDWLGSLDMEGGWGEQSSLEEATAISRGTKKAAWNKRPGDAGRRLLPHLL